MVLVNGFGIIDAAEKLRGVVLRYTDQHLKEKKDVGGETENPMGGCEMGGTVGEFIIFDDDEAGEKGKKASDVQGRVDVCAELFLLGGMCRLENEDGLGYEEKAGRVEELEGLGIAWGWEYRGAYGMGVEEHQRRMAEYSSPDHRYELWETISHLLWGTENGFGDKRSIFQPGPRLRCLSFTWSAHVLKVFLGNEWRA